MLPAALARRSSRQNLALRRPGCGRGRPFLGSGSLTGSLLGDNENPIGAPDTSSCSAAVISALASRSGSHNSEQRNVPKRPATEWRLKHYQQREGTRTEATVMVVAATRAFSRPRSAGPGRSSRLKAGNAQAEHAQAKGEASRWVTVVGSTVALLASLVLIATPSAAAIPSASRSSARGG